MVESWLCTPNHIMINHALPQCLITLQAFIGWPFWIFVCHPGNMGSIFKVYTFSFYSSNSLTFWYIDCPCNTKITCAMQWPFWNYGPHLEDWFCCSYCTKRVCCKSNNIEFYALISHTVKLQNQTWLIYKYHCLLGRHF